MKNKVPTGTPTEGWTAKNGYGRWHIVTRLVRAIVKGGWSSAKKIYSVVCVLLMGGTTLWYVIFPGYPNLKYLGPGGFRSPKLEDMAPWAAILIFYVLFLLVKHKPVLGGIVSLALLMAPPILYVVSGFHRTGGLQVVILPIFLTVYIGACILPVIAANSQRKENKK